MESQTSTELDYHHFSKNNSNTTCQLLTRREKGKIIKLKLK